MTEREANASKSFSDEGPRKAALFFGAFQRHKFNTGRVSA